jgi:ribonuclease P protein component
VPFSPAGAPKGATSSRSVTNVAFETQSNPISVEGGGFGFPKASRILRSSDFRKVYDEGFRFTCQHFVAFCVADVDTNVAQQDGPKFGFTVSRAMGNAVVRNRMRRRMREAVRLRPAGLDAKWRIVFNPRKPILTAKREAIERDVKRLLQQCANS